VQLKLKLKQLFITSTYHLGWLAEERKMDNPLSYLWSNNYQEKYTHNTHNTEAK
jgi:hypothetical protein